MKLDPKKLPIENTKRKKTLGKIFIIVGLLSVVTPFTPLGWLLILGFEMAGFRAMVWQRLKKWVDAMAKK